MVSIPDAVGFPQAEAELAIRDVDLEVGDIIPETEDSGPFGVVIGQFPDAGAVVEAGTSVDLFVPSKPSP